jgi:hypothetical protein
MELTAQQIRILENLHARGFEIVAFPMYAEYVGVRRGECAALLAPVDSGGFRLFGEPTRLVGGNLAVRVTHPDGQWFVRKQERVAASPERIAELELFSADLSTGLVPVA